MIRTWLVIYDYSPRDSGVVYVTSKNMKNAKSLIKKFLIEKQLWETVGFHNLLWYSVDIIPDGEESVVDNA